MNNVMLRFAVLNIAAALGCLVGCGSSGASKVVVADTGGNRVLIFDAPFTMNESASVVLGQADFTHTIPTGTAANTLFQPSGVAQGPHDSLVVLPSSVVRASFQYEYGSQRGHRKA